MHVKLRQLESLLAVSIPRREAKAEADSLRAKVAQMQDRLVESVPKAELEAKVNELEIARKTIEDLRWKLLHPQPRSRYSKQPIQLGAEN